MGWQVHSCGLGFEEYSRGVGTGGILVIECKVLRLQVCCCRVWSVVCGRVANFGSRIRLSGELVLEFNYFEKCQVFEFLNPVGWATAKAVQRLRPGGKKMYNGWVAQNSPSSLNRFFF
jgi:hypothetical protein